MDENNIETTKNDILLQKTERLKEAYEYLKRKKIIKTQEDVAEKIKGSRTNVSSALNGSETALTDSFISRFCAAYTEISYTWLLLGFGEMLTNKEKTVIDRIKDILRIEGLSIKGLNDRSGEDFDILQKCIEEDVEPSDGLVEKFCKVLNINEEFIRNGTGEMYDSDQAFINKSALKKHMEMLPTRPRLPKNTADGHIEQYYGTGKKRSLCQEKPIITQFVDYDFSLILKNHRMSPKYDRGDELFFRKSEIIEWGNDYLIDTAEGAKFKKIKDGGDVVICESYNKVEFPEFEVPKKLIYGYYRLVGVLRIL